MQQAKIIEISASIAIQAAKFSCEYKIPMTDSIIYKTARMNEAIVWTQDIDFKDLEGVKYFKRN